MWWSVKRRNILTKVAVSSFIWIKLCSLTYTCSPFVRNFKQSLQTVSTSIYLTTLTKSIFEKFCISSNLCQSNFSTPFTSLHTILYFTFFFCFFYWLFNTRLTLMRWPLPESESEISNVSSLMLLSLNDTLFGFYLAWYTYWMTWIRALSNSLNCLKSIINSSVHILIKIGVYLAFLHILFWIETISLSMVPNSSFTVIILFKSCFDSSSFFNTLWKLNAFFRSSSSSSAYLRTFSR